MAEAILVSVLVPMLKEKAVSLIQDQINIILTADAKGELVKLQGTLSAIGGVLRHAELKQATDESVKNWLSRLKDAAYHASDLLDDFNLHLHRKRPDETWDRKLKREFVDFCTFDHNPVVFNTRMSNRIKEVVKKIESLADERNRYNLKVDDGTDEMVPAFGDKTIQTHAYVEASAVVGREKDVIKIADLLIAQKSEKNVTVLPILGMGGLGKTTLAQMVYDEPSVVGHFELRMWVFVSRDFNVAKIAKSMIETATGSGFGPSDMDSLQRSIRNIIGGKKYLLVLDDIWNEDPHSWRALANLLTFGAVGSAVIVTTRSGIASALMGTIDTFRLPELDEEDCWNLFKQIAFAGRAEERPDLVAIGREMARKCGGLPLAAITLGSVMALKEPEPEEWKSVLESKIWNLPQNPNDILPALWLSYYYLPSPTLKQCFAFCAIFPKGYVMEKEMLVKLWIANGFIPCKAESELESEGNSIFKQLEQRFFFQHVKEDKRWYDGNSITTCTMHDFIHDLARSIMGNECSTLDNLDDISNTTYRHLLLNYEGKPGKRLLNYKGKPGKRQRSGTTVRTLLLRDSNAQSHVEYRDFEAVHVNLYGVTCTASSKNPGAPSPDSLLRGNQSDPSPLINCLNTTYLRALSLHNIGLTDFPVSICKLMHLRYLDLSRNDIKTIPEAINLIFSLQTLDLGACGQLLMLPKSLKHMSSLMHIYLGGCNSLKCMPKGMGQLRHLQTLTRYTVGSGAGSGSIAELRDLKLRGMLQLCNLKNVEDVADAQGANLGSKDNIKLLDLDWGESDAESTAGNAEQVLQALQPHKKLKQLMIRHYQAVQFPVWLSKFSKLFTNLVEIILTDCSKCEHLPQLWQVPTLQILEIKNMKSLKDMGCSEFNGTTGAIQDRKIFPSLRILKLHDIPNLEEWSGVDEESFPKIVEIEIVNCPNLTTMPALPSTKILQVKNCPLLHPANGFFRTMKYLKAVEIDSCDKMALMLEQEEETEVSLKQLQIKNCKQLMFASPSFGLWKYFTSLQDLKFYLCYELIMLPLEIIQALTSLKRLVIHCCYNLIGTSEEEEGLKFQGLPSLEELNIQVCTSFPCFHPEGLRQLSVKKLLIYSNHGLRTLPEFPDSVRDVTIYNCWNLESLPEGLGRLPELERFVLISLNWVKSMPEEIEGYKALNTLKIEDCRRMDSLPEGIKQRLPHLSYLEIKKCPKLEGLCMPGGEYWHLVSAIPVRYIGETPAEGGN